MRSDVTRALHHHAPSAQRSAHRRAPRTAAASPYHADRGDR